MEIFLEVVSESTWSNVLSGQQRNHLLVGSLVYYYFKTKLDLYFLYAKNYLFPRFIVLLFKAYSAYLFKL